MGLNCKKAQKPIEKENSIIFYDNFGTENTHTSFVPDFIYFLSKTTLDDDNFVGEHTKIMFWWGCGLWCNL